MEDLTIQRIEASLAARGEKRVGTGLRRVLSACVATPWAMTEEKLSDIEAFLELRLEGHLSDEEIRAQLARPARRTVSPPNGVAVIPIYGVISKRASMLSDFSGGTSIEKLQASIEAAFDDPGIGHIVFDVDSPGGSAPGVFELAEWLHAQRGRKPMTAVSNDLMASAAYAIASAADEVVVTPGSLTGSIGVYMMRVDVSGMDRMLGVKSTLIKFGKYKGEGDPHQPMTDEERAHKQETVDYYGQMFLAAVARNRGTTPEAVYEGFGEGRAINAGPAVESGLADRVATLDDVLAELGVSHMRPTVANARAEEGAAATATVVIPVGMAAGALIDFMAAPGSSTITLGPTTPAEPEPHEIPADATEGAPDAQASPPEATPAAPRAKEHTMSDVDTAAQDRAEVVAVTRDESAIERAQNILALCAAHGASSEMAQAYVAGGKSPVEVGQDLLKRKRESIDAFANPVIEMTTKEAKRYSLSKAILALADGDVSRLGFEREVHEELSKRLPGDSYKPKGGLLVPTRVKLLDAESMDHIFHPRAQLKTSSATAGQTLVFTEPGDFIDLLRNRMVLAQLGATFLTGLQGNVSFPKQTGAGTFEWVAEDPGSDQSDADATLGSVALNPKEGQATTAYTRKLLAQAVIDVDALIADDLSKITGLGIELGAINGSGASNQPTGILNTNSIGDVALGVNGAVPTFTNIIALETAVADANADIGTMGYLTTAGMRGVLKGTAKFSNTGVPIWDGGEMNGYRAEVSNTVPKTLTKGGSSTCHAIIFGVWSQLMVGYWGAYELVADPYSKKKQGLIEVTSHQIVGVAIRHPESFAAIQDALTTAYVGS